MPEPQPESEPPEPEPEAELIIDWNDLCIDSHKVGEGDSKTKAEDESSFIQGDDGSDKESEDGGFLIQGDDDSDEEYTFQCTQEPHWAQAPSMPYGNNAC